MFELESEYTRMGVPNNEWAAVNINSSYEICDTYVWSHLFVIMLRFSY